MGVNVCEKGVMCDTMKVEWILHKSVKGVVWYVLGTGQMALITYYITGSIRTTTVITGAYFTIRLLTYIIHEYIWDRIMGYI